MPRDLQHEAIAKFLITDCPQQDNYLDPDEWEEKEKEWEEKWDLALAQCVAWVEKEQVAEAKHSVEAAHVAAEKQKLQHEVAEHKQMTAAQKKLGPLLDFLPSRFFICPSSHL